jgi:CheY-like chemotaxis protein
MTGAQETAYVAACLEAGMDRFLSKPFGPAQLRRVLESVAAEPVR